MASYDSDDESLSQILLPERDVTDSNLSVGFPNTNSTSQNNTPTDQTTVSSLSSGICQPVSTTVDHTKSYLSHPYYTVLNGGRRSLLKNMEFRIELLHSILALNSSTYLPKELCDEPHVQRWFSTHTAYLKAPRKWNRSIMAKAICEFDSIMKESQAMVASSTIPPPLRDFYAYMEDVSTTATLAENEPVKTKYGRVGGQVAGKRVQDSINISDITRSKLDLSNCANCKHNFLLPIGLTQNQINLHNDKVKNDYRTQMYNYNHMSKSRKVGEKPKMARSLSMKLACLCTRMHCLNHDDGMGCLKCEWSCIENVKKGKDVRPYFDQNNDCMCNICKCQCSVVYYRHEEKNWQLKPRTTFWQISIVSHNQRLIVFLGSPAPLQI